MVEENDVKKYAQLARIRLSNEETEELKNDIDAILSYFREIQEVSSEDSILNIGDHINIMRDDTSPHESGIYTEVLLAGVPKSEGDYIRVKKIL